MPGTTKRLDLQFGSFACSVQGFDDPVQPVRQVLQALQNLLEETPDIADAGISFDAEAIERLVGEIARRADLDEENIEIVPGLIIVHRRGDGDADAGDAGDAEPYDDASGDGDETWSRPFVADAADTVAAGAEDAGDAAPDESQEPEAAEDARPAFVNIFAPGAHADAGGETDPAPIGAAAPADAADTDPHEAPHAPPEEGPEDAPARDIFADTGESAGGSIFADTGESAGDNIFADTGESAGGSIFADPMAADTGADPADEAEPTGDIDPVNLFSTPDSADESAGEPGVFGPGESGNVFAGVEPKEAGEDTPEDPGDDPGDDPEQEGNDAERVETLFGRSEDQPEIVEADEGYTAAGLAQTAGAETVAEFMVTAAAWMVLIQGQTTFTRRDVVKVFETIPGEHSKTLEARVKGFGKAVRNGQLIMVEDGVFGLSRTELERFQLLL